MELEHERVVVSDPPRKNARASRSAFGSALVCLVSCLFGVVCVQLLLMSFSPSLNKNREFVVVLVSALLAVLAVVLCAAAVGCCVEGCE